MKKVIDNYRSAVIMLVSPQVKEVGAISERDWLLLILTVASLVDLTWYKVSNKLIISALLFSLFWRLQTQGFNGIVPWIIGIVVPIVICFLFFMCHMIGASDIKIYSVIGSFVEIRMLLAIMIGSLFCGAVMSVGKMIIRNNFSSRFRHFFSYVNQTMKTRKLGRYYDVKKDGADGVIPFVVAITISSIYFLYS